MSREPGLKKRSSPSFCQSRWYQSLYIARQSHIKAHNGATNTTTRSEGSIFRGELISLNTLVFIASGIAVSGADMLAIQQSPIPPPPRGLLARIGGRNVFLGSCMVAGGEFGCVRNRTTQTPGTRGSMCWAQHTLLSYRELQGSSRCVSRAQ
jgi:hypothetical protein